jgi:GTPase SAR1 family protein
MAKKKKETCPFCGKQFVRLNRHKCKLKPKSPDKALEAKRIEIEDRSDQIKEGKKRNEHVSKRDVAYKESDIIRASHSETVRFISKFFKPGTIKLTKEKDKKIIKDLLKNPIESYNFLNMREVNFIKVLLMCSNIGDLLQYADKDIYEIISTTQLDSLEKKGINISELLESVQKAITISSILHQLKEKSIKLEKEAQKIIIAGLDKAGKTAILTTYSGELGIENLSKLRPTIEVDRKVVETKDFRLVIWDFGGQTMYRQKYLQNPSAYFLKLSVLLYVIDIQDYQRFDESFEYFKEILKALRMLEEAPYVLVFIHKYDPDLREDPDIQLNVEFVKENLSEILAEAKDFEYEVYLTSIYSVITKEPKFSKFIKEMVNERDLVVDPTIAKIEELGNVIENSIKAIITLSESVSQQFKQIDARFNRLEGQIKGYATQPPKIKDKSLSSQDGIQQKISQMDATQNQGMISLPSLTSLHPPPPSTISPPIASSTPDNKPVSQENIRSTIISELKQLFTQVKKQEF